MLERIFNIQVVVSGDKIYGVSGMRLLLDFAGSWSNNHETLCYCINDDSWNILPQASYKEVSEAYLISLGDFIYMICYDRFRSSL
jgi:hypothetical protein